MNFVLMDLVVRFWDNCRGLRVEVIIVGFAKGSRGGGPRLIYSLPSLNDSLCSAVLFRKESSLAFVA